MTHDTATTRNHLGKEVLRVAATRELLRDYQSLLDRLYPGRISDLPFDFFERLDADPYNLLVTRTVGQTIVSTAQATLIPVEPDWNILVSNVITNEDFDGGGHGRAVMEYLVKVVRQRWSRPDGRQPNIVLTNNPKKGNAGFYQKLGWVRVPTQVWALPR